jgi:hypothetical protein
VALQPFLLDLGRFFSFFNFYIVGTTPWTGDQSIARPLPTHRTTQTQNKRTQTFMPRVGFEPTIPVFERAKTFHALDRATTVTDGSGGIDPHIIHLSTSEHPMNRKRQVRSLRPVACDEDRSNPCPAYPIILNVITTN